MLPTAYNTSRPSKRDRMNANPPSQSADRSSILSSRYTETSLYPENAASQTYRHRNSLGRNQNEYSQSPSPVTYESYPAGFQPEKQSSYRNTELNFPNPSNESHQVKNPAYRDGRSPVGDPRSPENLRGAKNVQNRVGQMSVGPFTAPSEIQDNAEEEDIDMESLTDDPESQLAILSRKLLCPWAAIKSPNHTACWEGGPGKLIYRQNISGVREHVTKYHCNNRLPEELSQKKAPRWQDLFEKCMELSNQKWSGTYVEACVYVNESTKCPKDKKVHSLSDALKLVREGKAKLEEEYDVFEYNPATNTCVAGRDSTLEFSRVAEPRNPDRTFYDSDDIVMSGSSPLPQFEVQTPQKSPIYQNIKTGSPRARMSKDLPRVPEHHEEIRAYENGHISQKLISPNVSTPLAENKQPRARKDSTQPSMAPSPAQSHPRSEVDPAKTFKYWVLIERCPAPTSTSTEQPGWNVLGFKTIDEAEKNMNRELCKAFHDPPFNWIQWQLAKPDTGRKITEVKGIIDELMCNLHNNYTAIFYLERRYTPESRYGLV